MGLKVQPLQNFVIIKPGSKEELSKGGIVIPDTAQEKSQEGQVMAIGPGRLGKDNTREKLDVEVGDIVIYPKFGGTEIKIEGIDMVILPENQILAKKAK